MERKVREKGFIEKRDLKENLINETPNWGPAQWVGTPKEKS
jgi:hypothetical protein